MHELSPETDGTASNTSPQASSTAFLPPSANGERDFMPSAIFRRELRLGEAEGGALEPFAGRSHRRAFRTIGW